MVDKDIPESAATRAVNLPHAQPATEEPGVLRAELKFSESRQGNSWAMIIWKPVASPLLPTLRTQVGHLPTSEKCQKVTFALQQIFLFDDPIGDGTQFRRHRETERSSSLEVDE
jgi:hypothetical protein